MASIIATTVEVLKLLWEVGKSATLEVKRACLHGVVYMAMSLALYYGWHVVRSNGDLRLAWHSAFEETNQQVFERGRQYNSEMLQRELMMTTAADHQVNALLASVLIRAPSASRVRVAVIHNGVTGLTGINLLFFDILYARAAPGRDAGPIFTNVPLSEWVDFLPALLADKCVAVPISLLSQEAATTRLRGLGVSSFLGCPIRDPLNQMLGVVFLLWDGNDKPPIGRALDDLEAEVKGVGRQIGVALDLRKPHFE